MGNKIILIKYIYRIIIFIIIAIFIKIYSLLINIELYRLIKNEYISNEFLFFNEYNLDNFLINFILPFISIYFIDFDFYKNKTNLFGKIYIYLLCSIYTIIICFVLNLLILSYYNINKINLFLAPMIGIFLTRLHYAYIINISRNNIYIKFNLNIINFIKKNKKYIFIINLFKSLFSNILKIAILHISYVLYYMIIKFLSYNVKKIDSIESYLLIYKENVTFYSCFIFSIITSLVFYFLNYYLIKFSKVKIFILYFAISILFTVLILFNYTFPIKLNNNLFCIYVYFLLLVPFASFYLTKLIICKLSNIK